MENGDVAAQLEPAAAQKEPPGSAGHITNPLRGFTELAVSTGATTKCLWRGTERGSHLSRPKEATHHLPLSRKFREKHRNPHRGELHEHLQKMRREQEASERAGDLCGVRTEGGTRPDLAGLRPCLQGDASRYPWAEPFPHAQGVLHPFRGIPAWEQQELCQDNPKTRAWGRAEEHMCQEGLEAGQPAPGAGAELLDAQRRPTHAGFKKAPPAPAVPSYHFSTGNSTSASPQLGSRAFTSPACG